MFDEKLLHFIWQHQRFNREKITTEAGEGLKIIKAGQLNQHSGPDFFNGQIRIDSILWVGNIEIHLRSSDWYRHEHHHDPAYDKVILHVVWEHDREVFRKDGKIIPVLELKGRVPKRLIGQYQGLIKNRNWIPCQDRISEVDEIHKHQMLDRMLMNRLERKSGRIKQLLALHKNDWEAVFYQILARYFGFKVNALPFELLAINTPYSLLRKYVDRPIQLEALLFGQAGFLNAPLEDSYQQKLKREYEHLKKLHHLSAMEVSLWKFLRMRPANFPTMRIAQFAAFFHAHSRPFQKLRDCSQISNFHALLKVSPSLYWQQHYHFARASASNSTAQLGASSREVLLINVVVPLLFCWLQKHQEKEAESVLKILESVASENNSQIRKWKQLGWQVMNAHDSQALLELKSAHCELKKCLTCTIGNAILKTEP